MAQTHSDNGSIGPIGREPNEKREVEALHGRLDALERRLDQRFGEIRAKQEEELMLIKAMSCQLRGRVERADRRGSRTG